MLSFQYFLRLLQSLTPYKRLLSKRFQEKYTRSVIMSDYSTFLHVYHLKTFYTFSIIDIYIKLLYVKLEYENDDFRSRRGNHKRLGYAQTIHLNQKPYSICSSYMQLQLQKIFILLPLASWVVLHYFQL